MTMIENQALSFKTQTLAIILNYGQDQIEQATLNMLRNLEIPNSHSAYDRVSFSSPTDPEIDFSEYVHDEDELTIGNIMDGTLPRSKSILHWVKTVKAEYEESKGPRYTYNTVARISSDSFQKEKLLAILDGMRAKIEAAPTDTLKINCDDFGMDIDFKSERPAGGGVVPDVSHFCQSIIDALVEAKARACGLPSWL